MNPQRVRLYATIAARTASTGDVTGGKCNTAKNKLGHAREPRLFAASDRGTRKFAALCLRYAQVWFVDLQRTLSCCAALL
jgi:hypothetical protein